MEHDILNPTSAEQAPPKGKGARPLLGPLIAAFVLGGAAAGYFAWRDDFGVFSGHWQETQAAPESPASGTAPPQAEEPSPVPSRSEERKAAEAAQAVEKVAEQQGGLEARVVAMEQRIDQLNLQAQAASGNAARAEALLVAFASRRSVERGASLGYLADQLELRFGDAQPNAVKAVIAASERPATVDQLIARLEALGPKLVNESSSVSWEWFKRELGELFIVRSETSPSPLPERRLARARRFLESGRIDAAVAEVRNLPRASAARDWIADAERYAAAQRALDLLETTALLEPRNLRDGTGRQVEQRSPAD